MEEKKTFGKGLAIGIISGSVGMFIMAAAIIIFGMNVWSLGFMPENNSSNKNELVFKEGGKGPNGGFMCELTEAESFVVAKIGYLLSMVDSEFLFDYDEDDLIEGLYYGMIDSLGDVYSTYYNVEEFNTLMESTEGIYYGIGVSISADFKIMSVFPNTPAFEAGMLVGDILVAVDDKDISGENLDSLVSKIRSDKEGSKVKLTVVRDGNYVSMDVERRKVEYPTIEYEMLDNNIGYIKLIEFDTVSKKQFQQAVTDLNAQGMKGLVMDLRNNPGGTLDSVVNMLDLILPECRIIYMKDKHGNIENEYMSDAYTALNVPAVAIVNGNSASAAEVFAGDIQDMGVATLVGTTTFGKGIVQQIYSLGDGTAVKLTQSGYYTSGGRNIHGVGIEPDVYVELDEALWGKSVIEKSEDNQLQKALEVLADKMAAAAAATAQ